jgi:hypothetical protein
MCYKYTNNVDTSTSSTTNFNYTEQRKNSELGKKKSGVDTTEDYQPVQPSNRQKRLNGTMNSKYSLCIFCILSNSTL